MSEVERLLGEAAGPVDRLDESGVMVGVARRRRRRRRVVAGLVGSILALGAASGAALVLGDAGDRPTRVSTEGPVNGEHTDDLTSLPEGAPQMSAATNECGATPTDPSAIGTIRQLLAFAVDRSLGTLDARPDVVGAIDGIRAMDHPRAVISGYRVARDDLVEACVTIYGSVAGQLTASLDGVAVHYTGADWLMDRWVTGARASVGDTAPVEVVFEAPGSTCDAPRYLSSEIEVPAGLTRGPSAVGWAVVREVLAGPAGRAAPGSGATTPIPADVRAVAGVAEFGVYDQPLLDTGLPLDNCTGRAGMALLRENLRRALGDGYELLFRDFDRGYAMDAFGHDGPTAAYGDLDGNGTFELAVLRADADGWAVSVPEDEGIAPSRHGPLVQPAVWYVDVDDDGQGELLVSARSNTVTEAVLVVLRGRRLQSLARSHGLHWSMRAPVAPSATGDVSCGPGATGLVFTASLLVPEGWSWDDQAPTTEGQRALERSPRPARAWTRVVYAVGADELVVTSQDRGVLGPGEEVPPDLPLDNRLDCDGAVDPP